MATNLVCIEWHLTPRGWVQGNWSINKPLILESPPPQDGVETWMKTQIILDSDYSRTQYLWSLTWASPKHSEADLKSLRATIREPAPESESLDATSLDFLLE